MYVLWEWADYRISKDFKSGVISNKLNVLKCDLNRVTDSIKSENTFAEERSGWLYAANGLFATAFVTLFTAENLSIDNRNMLHEGLALFGAITSFSITVPIFLSHALLEKLKNIRKKLEKKLASSNENLILVLPANKPSHTIGHYGTRVTSAIMCVGWIALAILVDANQLELKLKTDPQPPIAFKGTQLKHIADFTYFTLSLNDTAKNKEGIVKKLTDLKKEEIQTFFRGNFNQEEWIKLKERTTDRAASIILVGKADCLPFKNSYDSNMVLARQRAEKFNEYLKKIGILKGTDQVLVLVNSGNKRENCNDLDARNDRIVEMWTFSD